VGIPRESARVGGVGVGAGLGGVGSRARFITYTDPLKIWFLGGTRDCSRKVGAGTKVRYPLRPVPWHKFQGYLT